MRSSTYDFIKLSFLGDTKNILIQNTYKEFLEEFQVTFEVDNEFLNKINFILFIEEQYHIVISNEKDYNDFFNDESILKKLIIGKAIIENRNEIEKKCIFFENEIRKNENQLKNLKEEIKKLLEKKNSLIENIKEKREIQQSNILYQNKNREGFPIFDSKSSFKKENFLSKSNEDSNKLFQKKKKKNEMIVLQNDNTIKINQNEISKSKPIIFKAKVRKNKKSQWPKKVLFFCIQDDSDIYFKHVSLFNNQNVVKSYTNNDEIIYNIPIQILFKNYKNIIKKTYSLNAVLISDSEEFQINFGQINLEVF